MTTLDKLSSMARLVNTEPERVVEDYPGEVRITEHSVGTDGDTIYYFDAPMHEPMYFDDPDTARLYADVYFDVDSFREEKSGERGVPPAGAAAGTDTLAAYLITQQGMSTEWLMRWMDVERETVHTYLSRVRTRAEERREELSED